MTTYMLVGRLSNPRTPPPIQPTYQNVMVAGAYPSLPHGIPPPTPTNTNGAPNFFAPSLPEDLANMYSIPHKYNQVPYTQATPPSSLGHRRKFSSNQPPISYSDAMLGNKAGSISSKVSSHSLQTMQDYRRVESPELPAIHYRNLYLQGSGSLKQQDSIEERRDGITGRRPETEGDSSGPASSEDEEDVQNKWSHVAGPSSTTCSPTTPSSMSPTTHTPLTDSVLSPTSSRRTTPNTPPSPMAALPQSPSRRYPPASTHREVEPLLQRSINNYPPHPAPGLGLPGTALTQIRENPMFVCESTTEDESNSPPCLLASSSYDDPRNLQPTKRDMLEINDIMKALGHPDQVISISPFPTSSGASTPSSWRGPLPPASHYYHSGGKKKRNVPLTVPRSPYDTSRSSSPPNMYDPEMLNGYSFEDYLLPYESSLAKASPVLPIRTSSLRYEDDTESVPPITTRPFPEFVLHKQHSLPDYTDQEQHTPPADRYGTMPMPRKSYMESNNRMSRGSDVSSKSSGSDKRSSSISDKRLSNVSPPPLPTPPISENSRDNSCDRSLIDDRRESTSSSLVGPLVVSEPVQREAVRQSLMNGTEEEDVRRNELKRSDSSAFSKVVPMMNGQNNGASNGASNGHKDMVNTRSFDETWQNSTEDHSSSTDSNNSKNSKTRIDAPMFQIKRRQKHAAPQRLCRSLDYIPSDLEDAMSNVSSRAQSPLFDAQQYMTPFPSASLQVRPKERSTSPQLPFINRRVMAPDTISMSSMCSSEMSRSDPALNYDSAGSSAAYESEYDNYRPGMTSDEDYYIPEPISDMDIDAFDDINVDTVQVSDSLGMDLSFSLGRQKKITDV